MGGWSHCLASYQAPTIVLLSWQSTEPGSEIAVTLWWEQHRLVNYNLLSSISLPWIYPHLHPSYSLTKSSLISVSLSTCSLFVLHSIKTHTYSSTTLHILILLPLLTSTAPHPSPLKLPSLTSSPLHLLTSSSLNLTSSSSHLLTPHLPPPAPPAPLDPLIEANQTGGPLTFTLIFPQVSSVNGPIR